MLMTIADVLGEEERGEIVSTLSRMRFEDGRATAGRSARLVKDNEQARAGPTLELLRGRVAAALLRHELFALALRPKALVPLVFSRYGVGQLYGTHVDNPLMNGLRTDVSFTLFLAPPESYDGGELVIESAAGEDDIKLPAGHLVLYPSTSLHRVAPVTRGERLVAVGWAQSYLRDPAQRELLFDLDIARRNLFAQHGKTTDHDLLAKTSANLMRLWADA